MGSFSITHLLIILVVILIIFGAGKLPKVMGDFAQGIKNFKKGMADDSAAPPATTAAQQPVEPAKPIDASKPANVNDPALASKDGTSRA
jgi:sec-independent protein translocase protein TatA